jgi:hypothetical protein
VNKLLLAATVLLFGALGYVLLSQPTATVVSDVASSGLSTALKIKTESGITLKIASQRQRMQLALAMASEKAPENEQIADIHRENATLHQSVNDAQQQLQLLGESPLAIEQWLTLVNWPQFLSEEKVFSAQRAGSR